MAPRKLTVGHVLLLLLGLAILAFAAVAVPRSSEYVLGIAVPTVGGVLVAVGLSALIPKKAGAGLVGLCVLLGFVGVTHKRGQDRERWGAERRAREMTKVCDGAAVDAVPNGAKLRVLNGYHGPTGTDPVSWQDDNLWPAADVPAFALCIDATTATVSTGDFIEEGSRRRTQVSTYEHLAHVRLRKIPSGEVVFEKSYRGGPAPALPSTVVYGGPGNTNLGGTPVSRAEIMADVAPLLDASVAVR